MTRLTIKSLNQLDDTAKEFINLVKGYPIIAFYGKMGSGKTTFIASLCQNMGSEDIISSPTFSLINEYNSGSGNPIFHFDFYRIKDISEVYDIGYEDYFFSGELCLLEWPELIEDLLPDDAVKVYITVGPSNERHLDIEMPTNNL